MKASDNLLLCLNQTTSLGLSSDSRTLNLDHLEVGYGPGEFGYECNALKNQNYQWWAHFGWHQHFICFCQIIIRTSMNEAKT